MIVAHSMHCVTGAVILLAVIPWVCLGELPGHYRSHHRCKACPPGTGLTAPCNQTHPSVCDPCPQETYSPSRPHYRLCRSCSQCGPGLYVDVPCTDVSDTICDSCDTVKGQFTADYIRKCVAGKFRSDLTSKLHRKSKFYGDMMAVPLLKLMPASPQNPTEKFGLKSEFHQFHADKEPVPQPGIPLMKLMPASTPEPRPVMGPGPAVLDDFDSDSRHQFREWDGEIVPVHEHPVRLTPSVHDYPDDVSAALRAQCRKLYILIAMTIVVFGVTLGFVVCLIRNCLHSRRRTVDPKSQYQLLQRMLREQDKILIKDSAQRLEWLENGGKCGGYDSRMGVSSSEGQRSLTIVENPLQRLLDSSDESLATY